MAKKPIALTIGSYEARSLTAEAQRCINLYPEKNPEDAAFPFTLYPCPGLVTLSTHTAPTPGRGLYVASDGRLFACAGGLFFLVNSVDWSMTAIGQLNTSVGLVGIKDNGSDLLVSDGSSKCYTTPLTDLNLRVHSDPNCIGSDFIDLIDGFFLLNQPKSRNWYTSLDNTTEFDPTFVAAKDGSNDPLKRVIAVHREAWLIGSLTSEVWYDAGNNDGMSFSIIPGAFIQHGTVSKDSVATWDSAVFWLAQSPQGTAYVLMGMNYAAKPISTAAVSEALSRYEQLSDAIGFCYEQSGHAFYCLSFPFADKTWVYDISQGLWHERAWTDSNGFLHRFRPCSIVSAYGRLVAQDWQTGALYAVKEGVFTDTYVQDPDGEDSPYPPYPAPSAGNTVLELAQQTTTPPGQHAEFCLVDWDSLETFACMTHSDTADGIYVGDLLTGVLKSRVLSGYIQDPEFLQAICLTPTNIYCISSLTNITKLYQINRKTLSITSMFGKEGTFYSDPATEMRTPTWLSYLKIGPAEFILTGMSAASDNKLFLVGEKGIIWTTYDFEFAMGDSIPVAGASTTETGTFYVLNRDHASPFATVDIYSVSIRLTDDPNGEPRVTTTLIRSLIPSDIDPTWTKITDGVQLGYDATDDTLLAWFDNSLDTVTNAHYLLKMSPIDGSVKWQTPFTHGLANSLRDCRIRFGLLAVFTGEVNPTAYVVDTLIGTVVATHTTSSFTAGTYMHDDTTGLVVAFGQFGPSAGNFTPINGTPSSFTGWFQLIFQDNQLVGGQAPVSAPRGSIPVPGDTFPNQMSFIRSFPHIVSGGDRLQLNSLALKVDAGRTSQIEQAAEPIVSGQTVSLRYSTDGGQAYGQAIDVSLGLTGEFFTTPVWRRLGVSLGRDCVFEVSWSGGGIRALLGAWLDAEGLDT